MKIGLVGGIGPASTLDYYSSIVEGWRAQTGGKDYPELVLDSINMTRMLSLVEKENWNGLTSMLQKAVRNLEQAGAELAAIASNTPHVVFDMVEAQSPLPLVSIVDAACDAAQALGYRKVGLLGTAFTMERDFYGKGMASRDIGLVVPEPEEQQEVHSIIFPNLEDGLVLPEQKVRMLEIAGKLIEREQIQALVLGCTELPLMIKPGDLPVPLLNTTQLHIEAIVRRMTAV